MVTASRLVGVLSTAFVAGVWRATALAVATGPDENRALMTTTLVTPAIRKTVTMTGLLIRAYSSTHACPAEASS